MENSNFTDKVRNTIAQHKLLRPEARVLVCVSGGADSVALLLWLRDAGFHCVVAHCNFGLRGAESDGDEAFVRELCNRLDVECEIIQFDVEEYRRNHAGVSVEMACRELRYAWFYDLLASHNCEAIAVGHNRNDRVETMFLNMFRGTGVTGIASIKYKNGPVVRPLLNVTRAEIVEFLESHNQSWRTDSSNAQSVYERNKVRNKLLPYVMKLFPNAAIDRTIDNLGSSSELYNYAVSELAAKVSSPISEGGVRVDMAKLTAIPGAQALLHEIMYRYGFNSQQAMDIADACQGAKVESKTHEAIVNRSTIEIIPLTHSDKWDDFDFILSPGSNLLDKITCCVEKYSAGYSFARDNRTLYLSAEVIGASARLRHWQQGDVIQPYGMGGKRRLLSDIFSDAKLSIYEKSRVSVLEIDGVIVWVPGFRASCHFPAREGEEMLVMRMI